MMLVLKNRKSKEWDHVKCDFSKVRKDTIGFPLDIILNSRDVVQELRNIERLKEYKMKKAKIAIGMDI